MSKYFIYSDGASKGNPGDAGIGVVISDDEGTPVREIGEYIGQTTNNVAEYKALIRGLQECLDLGATAVEISTDSELLARQISGVYKVKSENLKPLYAEVMSILRRFDSVKVSHVMREFNKRADELANQGVRRKSIVPGKHKNATTIPSMSRQAEKTDEDSGNAVQGTLEF